MSEDSQIVVPPSFLALFVPPGRLKPQAPRALIAQRYELCEDLAQMLIEHAQAVHFDSGADEAQVLQRVENGLNAQAPGAASVVSGAEARWVVRRLAELLGWPDPGERAGPPGGG